MASSTLRIPQSNDSICAAILNDTTVDLFALHRQQSVDDEADKTLLLRSKAQEQDVAFSPKIQPLSRYVGVPDRIKATMISDWELYAASASTLAKWNIKRTGRLVWESNKVPKAADWDEFEHEDDDDEETEDHLVGNYARLRGFRVDASRKWLWTSADCALMAVDIKTGRHVTPTQPAAPALAARRAAAAAIKAAGTPVGYAAASAQWASPPAWASAGAVHAPVVPQFEDSVDHMTLPKATYTSVSSKHPGMVGAQPPSAAVVASGGTGGVYAWDASGRPLWHYLAPPAAVKGKRDTGHLHAAVALAYVPRSNLVIVCDDTDVFALEADTGKRLQGWGFALKPLWGSNYVEHMSVNFSRQLVVLVGHSGRVLVVDAGRGTLLRHFTSSLFNAEISDFAVQHFDVGTQRDYLPTALGGAAPEKAEHLASWSGAAQSKFVISTLLVQDMNTASLAAVDIIADEDIQCTATAGSGASGSSGGAAGGEGHVAVAVEMDVSNPMREQGGAHPCDRIAGKIQATVLWHASGRNAEYGSGGVCASEEGVLLVGKARGDVQAWNITASAAHSAAPDHAGPVRWDKGVTDYLHFKPPWNAAEQHNAAAEEAAKAVLLRKLKAGKDKKDAAVELSEADADYTLLVQEAGVLVTSHSNGDLRAWQVGDGALKWVARADPAKDIADHIQYMAAFSTGSSDRLNAVAVFANIGEVATVVAFELASGDVMWKLPVFPKAYIECSLRGLFFVRKSASLIAAFEPYVADPEEDDEWAVKLTPQQKAEAKKDFECKPLIMLTMQSAPRQSAFSVTQRRVLRRIGAEDDCLQADAAGLAVLVADGSLSKLDAVSGRILWRTRLPDKTGGVSSWHWLPSSGVVILQTGGKSNAQLLCFSDRDGKLKHTTALQGNAAEHVAAYGLVACIEPGRGVRLLAADTLAPLHEHPFAFNGVPSKAAFVSGHSTSCLQSCNPGRKALKLAAGATGANDDTIPERLVVLGTSGEVFSLNLADFLGPLHLSSRLELGEHADAKGIKKLKAEQGLRIQAYVAAILKLVDFVQMASFAFKAAVPPSLEDSSNTLEDFQGLGLDFITYPVLLFMTVGVIVLFTAAFAVSERVEGWAFLNPNNTKATLAWAALKVFAQVMTSVALIPIMNTLASAVDCTERGGTLVWDAHGDDVQCFQGTHMLYVILAAVAFLLYIPNVLRLLQVGSNLDGVELQLTRPWDWSGDDRSETTVEHLLSEKRSIYSTVQAIIKVLAAVLLTLFGQRRRVLVSALVVVLGCALVATGVLRSPFHYALASHMRTALDVGITWTFVSSFVAALVIGDGEGAAADLSSTQDTLLSILPAGILLALPAAMMVQAYCCCAACCGRPLPQYARSTSKSAVGPRSLSQQGSSEVKSPLAASNGAQSSAGAASAGVSVPSPLSKLPDSAATAQMPDMAADDFSALAVQQHEAESEEDSGDEDDGGDDASSGDEDDAGDDASSLGLGSDGSSEGSLGLDL